LVLGAVWLLAVLSYSAWFASLPKGSPSSTTFSDAFTRSRMLMRSAMAFLVFSSVAVLALGAAGGSAASMAVPTGKNSSGTASFLQAGAVGGQKPERAALPTSKTGKLWPSGGGPMGDAGPCGDSLIGGAMLGALGFAGLADAIGLLLALSLLCPSVCPVCRDVRCGNARPETVRLPLFLAPAGLIWPPELRAELRQKMKEGMKANLAAGSTPGGHPVTYALGAAVAGRLRAAGMDPWREVEVEAWFRRAGDEPADGEERAIRDALLASVATRPVTQAGEVDTAVEGWAAAIPEVASLSREAAAGYLAAMEGAFGRFAVVHDECEADEPAPPVPSGAPDAVRRRLQPSIPVYLDQFDPDVPPAGF